MAITEDYRHLALNRFMIFITAVTSWQAVDSDCTAVFPSKARTRRVGVRVHRCNLRISSPRIILEQWSAVSRGRVACLLVIARSRIYHGLTWASSTPSNIRTVEPAARMSRRAS